MKKLIAIAALIAAPTVASAAGLSSMNAPAPAPAAAYDWSGIYVGGSVGVIRDTDDMNTSYYGGYYVYNWQQGGTSVYGALDIGYNFQAGSAVLGAEADFGGANAAGTFKQCETGYGCYSAFKDSITSLGTVRGRLGYAFDRTLIYVTGGLAYGHVSNSYWYYDYSPYDFNVSGMRAGWVVGAGVEQAIDHHWSISAKALYVDLGKAHASTTDGYYVYAYTFHNTELLATAGLNYKF